MPLTNHITLTVTDDAATEAEIVRFFNLESDKEIATMQGLLVEQLKELYDAENQIIDALANVPEASDAFSRFESRIYQLSEIREHARRLERVLDAVGTPPVEIASEARECHGCNESTEEFIQPGVGLGRL